MAPADIDTRELAVAFEKRLGDALRYAGWVSTGVVESVSVRALAKISAEDCFAVTCGVHVAAKNETVQCTECISVSHMAVLAGRPGQVVDHAVAETLDRMARRIVQVFGYDYDDQVQQYEARKRASPGIDLLCNPNLDEGQLMLKQEPLNSCVGTALVHSVKRKPKWD